MGWWYICLCVSRKKIHCKYCFYLLIFLLSRVIGECFPLFLLEFIKSVYKPHIYNSVVLIRIIWDKDFIAEYYIDLLWKWNLINSEGLLHFCALVYCLLVCFEYIKQKKDNLTVKGHLNVSKWFKTHFYISYFYFQI